jgi:hypothetical protein
LCDFYMAKQADYMRILHQVPYWDLHYSTHLRTPKF